MAYVNGRIPTTALVALPWSRGDLLRADAAAALTRLNAAFRAEFGHDLVVNEGYRDYATQVDYRARTRLPRTHPRWLPSASRPGTSQHGWGLAVDLGGLGGFGGAKYRWLVKNAPRFGFYQPAQYQEGGKYPEPWHWEYDPDRDTQSGRGDRPDAQEDDDMPLTDKDYDEIARRVWYFVDKDRGHTVPRYDALNEVYLTVRSLAGALAALPARVALAVWGFKRAAGAGRGPDNVDAIQMLADSATVDTGKAPDKIKHPSKRKHATDF